MIAEFARKISPDPGGLSRTDVLLHGPVARRRADCRHRPTEEAYTESLAGLEAFPALLSRFGRLLLGRLVDAQRSPFPLGAGARHSPPERQGGIAVEAQPLGYEGRPEGQNRGSVHADCSALFRGVH